MVFVVYPPLLLLTSNGATGNLFASLMIASLPRQLTIFTFKDTCGVYERCSAGGTFDRVTEKWDSGVVRILLLPP